MEFTASSVQMADLLSKKDVNVFLYRFEHRSTYSRFSEWMGVPHGEDIFYLFGCPLDGHPRYNYTDLDKKVSLGLIEMWSRFVYSGLPTGTLNDTYKINKTYIRMNSNNTDMVLTKGNNLRATYMGFWNELLPTLITNSDMDFKGHREISHHNFRVTILVVLLFLLFGLFVFTAGCLVYQNKKKQIMEALQVNGDEDVKKIPLL